MHNIPVKFAPFGRGTAQKRAAPNLIRYKSIRGAQHDDYESSCISAIAAVNTISAPP